MLRPSNLTLALLAATLAAPAGAALPERALFAQYCFGCHGLDEKTAQAGINLEELSGQQPIVRNREIWARVIGALEVDLMPPRGMPQPSEDERRRMHETLADAIEGFDYSKVDDPGFEPMRRLSHTEYDNTLRDLFGVDLDPTERFPEELSGESGFDNSANTLFLQSALMERYIVAAERVVGEALPAEPRTDAHRRARDLIFVATPAESGGDLVAAKRVMERFLLRAYRRPPTDDELQRALEQYRGARSDGQDFEGAVKQVLPSVLISPKFLLRVEAGRDDEQPFRVSDFELASRLSYFLWASMPDDELFELAARGELHEPAVLSQQVDRMLADPRADTLGTVFAGQWLGFRHVGTRIWLDPIDNPWCTDTLMTAMREESALFFLSLLRDDLPIRRLIDADYTFVNEELATALYAIEGIRGPQMRRIRFDDPNRGGIIGQGSILAVTSNYKDTSPVKRGNYILETLLGTPPPPPPADAGVLDEEVQKLKQMSFREKLEMHSSNEACRVCHSRIDPLGFSLENFDYFGRWREAYHFRTRVEDPEETDEVKVVEDVDAFAETRYYKNTYKTIDAAGSLPDGTSFTGPAGLKRALLDQRHDDLVRQVASKMLSYALGRQLEYYDEPAVRRIITELETNEYRFQTLLKAVVRSYPFQFKKNPTEETMESQP